MNAETFKKAAEILTSNGDYFIDFNTKKYMIEIVMSWDENGHLDNYDDDQHFSAYVGETYYSDGEITRTIARKADYLECSHGSGWGFYIGRNCSENVLDSAFEATIGLSLNYRAEWGELSDKTLDAIEALGIELEFAARNRAWNASAESIIREAVEIEEGELNQRQTKSEVRDNYQKWGGQLKIWDGCTWSFNDEADWKQAKFIQLIDADGGGEHWISPKLPKRDTEHFRLMMRFEMLRIRKFREILNAPK